MKLRVSLVQYDIEWENKEANMRRIESLLAQTNFESTDWIILPEMSLSGFSMRAAPASLTQEELDFFKNLARVKSVHISFGGVFESRNKAVTVDPSGFIIDDYAKIHLFSMSDENRFYKRGTESRNFTVKNFSVIPSICYDLRFSYLFWDFAKRSDLIFNIANWPSSREHHWRLLLSARAIENQCFVIGVNRTGADPAAKYSGSSMVISPNGDILLDAGSVEGVYTVQIDSDDVVQTRAKYPFLKDRLELPHDL